MLDIKKHIKIFGTTLMLLIACSCSDDLGKPVIPTSPEGQQPIKVRFRIPSSGPSFIASSTTRVGDEDPSQDVDGDQPDNNDIDYLGNGEAVISNLYLVGVQTTYESTYVVDIETGQTKTETYFMDKDRVVVTPLNAFNDSGIIGKDDYYELALYPGRYRFYLFCNTDLYVDNSIYNAGNSFTEEDVKQISLSYASEIPIRKGHIPMACLPEGFKYGTSRDNSKTPDKTVGKDEIEQYVNHNSEIDLKYYQDKLKNTIPITEINTPDIFAELTFLCAKVRYTILFDATLPTTDNPQGGISSGFGNNSIRFYVNDASDNTPSALNLRRETFIDLSKSNESTLDKEKDSDWFLLTSDETKMASWSLELNRYEWPKLLGEKYPTKPSDELTFFTGEIDDWKGSRKRAWQGIVYLPENNTQDVRHTILRFPYVMDKYPVNQGDPYEDGTFKEEDYKDINLFGGNNNEQHFLGNLYNQEYDAEPKMDQLQGETDFHGIERGRFYDVVARVINPKEWDLKVIVYGRVEDWHDIEQSITDGPSYEKEDAVNMNALVNQWQYEDFTNKW